MDVYTLSEWYILCSDCCRRRCRPQIVQTPNTLSNIRKWKGDDCIFPYIFSPPCLSLSLSLSLSVSHSSMLFLWLLLLSLYYTREMVGFSTRLGWLMSADELTKCTIPFDLSLECTAQTVWWASQIVWDGLCQQTSWPGLPLPYFVLLPVEGVTWNTCACRVCCSPLTGATRVILRMGLTELSCGSPCYGLWSHLGCLCFLYLFFSTPPSHSPFVIDFENEQQCLCRSLKLINL